jgi:acetyl esterase/lipase
LRSQELEGIVTMLGTTKARGTDLTVQEWREAYAGVGAFLPAREGVSVEPVDASGVPAEWIGEGDTGPLIVYLHGGGYCIGSLDTHRSMLTHLAAATGGRVLAVDYRLAPEHPFPAALDDALTAYRFAARSSAPERLVVAGDSAGGGLTVATLVALRDAGDPLPAAGVCLSPWVDLTQSGASIASKADEDPMVRGADLDRWAKAYAGERGVRQPAVSPLFADLAGLPPLLIEVGTSEVLLDDGRRLAERAQAADVDVTLHVAHQMVHVWHFFAGAVPEADEAIDRVAAFIRSRIH